MEVSLMSLFALGGGSFAAGCIIDRIISKFQADKREEAEKTLIRNFGALSTSTSFSFDEVMNWIEAHDELMQNGCDALVFKANNETLKLVNKQFNINFNKKNIQASLLVKYESLDKRLENEMVSGNGTLIIEGGAK
ncbi:MAG: hypothetical protein IJS99_06705 [Synergistaceae bacterium]|nr:hypothetical protein [Synergistaceae bacterium]